MSCQLAVVFARGERTAAPRSLTLLLHAVLNSHVSRYTPYKFPSLPAGAGQCVTPAWRAGWAPAALRCPAWSQLGAGSQLIPPPTTTTHCPPTTTSGWRGEGGGTGPPPPCRRRSHTKHWRLGWTVSSRQLLFFLTFNQKSKTDPPCNWKFFWPLEDLINGSNTRN